MNNPTKCVLVMEAVSRVLKMGVAGKGFDLRTTDMWLFLKKNGQYQKAWNILSPGAGQNRDVKAESGTPSIEMPSDSGEFEIHVRLKNFGAQTVSARIEGQTVEHGRADTHQGELMESEYKDIAPGDETVYIQTFPTWAQSNDQRTWVRVGNERQELADYKGSSRHLTYINVEKT